MPRKLSGSPHVEDTRVETQALAALADRGFSVEHIARLYPFLDLPAIKQSLDPEQQLARNSAIRAAA